MGDYKYIYLIFYPEGQIKRFYLMAYDSSSKETIISNGDIYDIDCSEKNKYEIQIFKPLKTNSLIQFLFLGLPENFYMEVEIRFKLNPILYLDDIKLNDENSLKSSDNENILKYLDEMDRKIIELFSCGRSDFEIAEELHSKKSTIQYKRNRIIEHLREKLKNFK